MYNRHTPRSSASARVSPAPVHRGPQAAPLAPVVVAGGYTHAPNAALLIDFDNVTLGIQKDLGKELRNLLSSDIIMARSPSSALMPTGAATRSTSSRLPSRRST